MSAVDTHALRLLLRAPVLGIASYPGDAKVAWQNRPFQPPAPTDDSALWLRETLIVGNERRTSSGFVEAIGIYQVDVFVPVGVGTEAVEDVSREIANALRAGTSLSGGETSTHIYRAERLRGRPDPGDAPLWFSIPVVAYWRTFTAVPLTA